MPNMVTLSRAGHAIGANSDREIMRALAQSFIKVNATGPLTDIVNNAGGVVSRYLSLPNPNFVSGAASGSDRANATNVAASLAAMQNALKTLYAKANQAAAAIGLAPVPYGGGGTDGAGTVAAIPSTVGGAATGPQDAESNTIIAAYNDAVFNLYTLVNRICEATGDPLVKTIIGGAYPNPNLLPGGYASALPVSFAVASASPGVSQAAWQAAITAYANGLTSIAAALATALLPGTVRVIPVA